MGPSIIGSPWQFQLLCCYEIDWIVDNLPSLSRLLWITHALQTQRERRSHFSCKHTYCVSTSPIQYRPTYAVVLQTLRVHLGVRGCSVHVGCCRPYKLTKRLFHTWLACCDDNGIILNVRTSSKSPCWWRRQITLLGDRKQRGKASRQFKQRCVT